MPGMPDGRTIPVFHLKTQAADLRTHSIVQGLMKVFGDKEGDLFARKPTVAIKCKSITERIECLRSHLLIITFGEQELRMEAATVIGKYGSPWLSIYHDTGEFHIFLIVRIVFRKSC